MQNLRYPLPSLARQDLEETWRLRCERARERYKRASAWYRNLLNKKPEGETPQPNDPLALARRAESEALAEYMMILKMFTELVVNGRIPDEELAASQAEAEIDRRHIDFSCRR